jgi:hypothetical protein
MEPWISAEEKLTILDRAPSEFLLVTPPCISYSTAGQRLMARLLARPVGKLTCARALRAPSPMAWTLANSTLERVRGFRGRMEPACQRGIFLQRSQLLAGTEGCLRAGPKGWGCEGRWPISADSRWRDPKLILLLPDDWWVDSRCLPLTAPLGLPQGAESRTGVLAWLLANWGLVCPRTRYC